MCIYCGTAKYRKIYENHFGKIPRDDTGRTYDIHHIDGNHNNNSPNNLKAVSIQDHYDIHLEQMDWSACLIMADRMHISLEEKSRLSTLQNLKRVENGTHHLLGGAGHRERIKAGTHNLVGDNNPTHKRIKDGTFHFLDGAAARERNLKRVKEGKHNFQVDYTCPHCGKIGKGGGMLTWHFDKCKFKCE